MRNINECIACRAFASLILDSEYPAADNLPAFVSCPAGNKVKKNFAQTDALKIF